VLVSKKKERVEGTGDASEGNTTSVDPDSEHAGFVSKGYDAPPKPYPRDTKQKEEK